MTITVKLIVRCFKQFVKSTFARCIIAAVTEHPLCLVLLVITKQYLKAGYSDF